MRALFFAVVIFCCVQMIGAQSLDQYKQVLETKMDLEKNGSGISGVFVDENGAHFLNTGTVTRDRSAKTVNEKTAYEIGSITKLFVGVLVADAVKRGEVTLDAPISTYLPKSVKTPKYEGKEMTLLDLASHSSGLPRLPDNLNPKNSLDPYADYSETKLFEFLSAYKLQRSIGSEFEYSNLGVGLLGHILAMRAKMSFEKLMTERLFKPLGMTDSSISLSPALKEGFAQGYFEDNKPTPPWTWDVLAGAGAIRTTAADMAKFVAASSGLTKTPLDDAFIEARTMRRGGQNARTRIGLCWNNADLYGTEVFWHGGGTFGFTSYIAVDPKQKKGAFLVINSGQQTGTVFLESIAFNYLQPKFAIVKPSPARTEIKLSKDLLDKYVGEYLVVEGVSIFITLEGEKLFGRATGQDKFELFAEKEDKFFAKVAGISISFEKDKEGNVPSLIISQAGNNTPAKKIK